MVPAPSAISGGGVGCAEVANPSMAALVRPVRLQHSSSLRRGLLLPTPNQRHLELGDDPTRSPGPTAEKR